MYDSTDQVENEMRQNVTKLSILNVNCHEIETKNKNGMHSFELAIALWMFSGFLCPKIFKLSNNKKTEHRPDNLCIPYLRHAYDCLRK